MSRVKSQHRTGLSRPGISRQREEEARPEEWWNSELGAGSEIHSMFAAQIGLNVYFLVEKCPQSQVLMSKYFSSNTCRDRQPGRGHRAMNGQSKDCSPLTSTTTTLECGGVESLAPSSAHFTQSNIPPVKAGFWFPQSSALLWARAISVSDEVTICVSYLPASPSPSLALNLYCFYTTISRGEFLSSLGVSIIVIIIPKLYKLFLFSIRKLSTIQNLKGGH